MVTPDAGATTSAIDPPDIQEEQDDGLTNAKSPGLESTTSTIGVQDEAVTIDECLYLVLLFRPGHDRRAISRSWKETLDKIQPVVVLGPPPFPARARFREAVGVLRAGYGVWSPAHKTISLCTAHRHAGRQRSARADRRWDLACTTSSIKYGHRQDSCALGLNNVDPDVACRFWKVVLRLQQRAAIGGVASPSHAGVPAAIGSLHIQLGSSPEQRVEYSEELVMILHDIEASADQIA